MGAVLALVDMAMGTCTRAVLSALILVMAGCSSETDKQPTLGEVAMGMARARLQKGKVETADTVKKAPQVTRAQIEALGRPVVFVSIPRFGSANAAVELAKNGSFRTYMGADQTTVTLQGGVVTATRGLLVDLIGQELSISPRALLSGGPPKTYTRSQRHLTGEGTLSTLKYTCAIAPNERDETIQIFGRNHTVRQFTELCQNTERAFQNSYWVNRASGTVWQSHQSVSKEVGHLVLQRVVQ